MEEQIWTIDHQSKAFQDFRALIRTLWDDEASRDINMRYLNPHEDDNEKMVEGFKNQYKKITEANERMASATEHAEIAEDLSREINQEFDYIEEDIWVAYQFNEQYKGYITEARGLIPDIDDLISQSNAACKGVADNG